MGCDKRQATIDKRDPGVLDRAARRLAEEGNQDAAEAVFRDALAQYRLQYGPHHEHTLVVMSNIAASMAQRGTAHKLKQAEAMYRHTLVLQREVLGPEHPDTLTSLKNLASVLRMGGKLEEAEKLQKEVDEVERPKLEPSRSLSRLRSSSRLRSPSRRMSSQRRKVGNNNEAEAPQNNLLEAKTEAKLEAKVDADSVAKEKQETVQRL